MITQAFKFPNKGHEDYCESFVSEMNKQANKLRLKNCKFSNPHGLQMKANHASAKDIICLMYHATKYKLLREICGKKTHKCKVYTHDLTPKDFVWTNTNKLINDFFIASKTGITPSAGPCLVSFFKLGGYQSIGVLIDSKTEKVRWREMAAILLWQLNRFLKINKICAYSRSTYEKFKKIKEVEREQRMAE